ncbi:hypothetical protein GCM10009122_34950 [Fulvivirga kasyanovii]|uniref:Uncharacterized protein n=1 Tax=Fulvivirga kasyanovii TaxID=396812 RepID=A0ABW9RJF4_9BACT|nr:hypothetical protein [Fulvivirga kasyanovii]MTI24204.1 hypothetical protein [Fulvivirga kasyanovii]
MTDNQHSLTNLQPLEHLLRDEDPLEIASLLDEILYEMVSYSESQGNAGGLGYRYHLVRLLRNAFSEMAKPKS